MLILVDSVALTISTIVVPLVQNAL